MLIISQTQKKEKQPLIRLAIQQRFTQARLFLNPLNTLIQSGFSGCKKPKTALGEAMSFLIRNAMVGEYPDIHVDPSLAKLSHGSLSGQSIDTIHRAQDTITLTWIFVTSRMSNIKWDDEFILCAYDVENGDAAINEDKVLRQDEKMELALPSILHGRPVHLYLVVHDREKKFFSGSQYLGFY